MGGKLEHGQSISPREHTKGREQVGTDSVLGAILGCHRECDWKTRGMVLELSEFQDSVCDISGVSRSA